MKLIFCPKCQDVVKMRLRRRFCTCRKSWGQYENDGLFAKIGGAAIAVGIFNASFIEAVLKRLAGQGEQNGPEFHGFIFPEKTERIQRISGGK